MRYLPLALCLLVLSAVGADPATTLNGRVVNVADGDTITVLVGKESIKVRLEGIDAPESSQAFGDKSKIALSKLVKGMSVTVNKTGEDQYKRTLGRVLIRETTVDQGLATKSVEMIDINAK